MASVIDDIRARFPHPRSAEGDPVGDGDYCVGGSIFLAALPRLPTRSYGYGTRFPSWKTLAYALRLHNPRLTDATAGRVARGIIRANDHERFKQAWSIATAALRGQ